MYLQGEEFSDDRNNDVFDASKQIISEEDSSNDQESSEKIASFKYGNELAEEEAEQQQQRILAVYSNRLSHGLEPSECE